MTKEKLLTFLVIALVALNTGLLIFLFTNRSTSPLPGHEPFQVIIDCLRLDDAQQSQFEQMRHDHHQRMMDLDKIFSATLSNYFDLLKDSESKPVLRDSLEAVMATIEKEKAKITFDHFQHLKSILRNDQKQNFHKLAPELNQIIHQRNPPPPRRN